MLAYVIRRAAYGVLVVLGVLLFLFLLFFGVTSPDDIARRALGEKAPPAAVEQWKVNHGYARPLWPWQDWDDNLLRAHFVGMLTFDFGRSDADDVPIVERIRQEPHITLHRLKDELAARGIKVSHNTVWMFLRREGLRFKKNTVRS